MSGLSPQSSTRRPLIVRLRNWIGDVVLSLPALQLLHDSGFDLILIGKPWAPSLLQACPFRVEVLERSASKRIAQLKNLAHECRRKDSTFDQRLNTVLFPFSFSSALEARCAGLRTLGYRYEGRRLLLKRSLALPMQIHESQRYWQLACAVVGISNVGLAPLARLTVSAEAKSQAQQKLAANSIRSPYIVIAPFSSRSGHANNDDWPGFRALASRLAKEGLRVVMCPGPNEVEMARENFTSTVCLEGVNVGTYAAILQNAAVVIANDSGPGHMAAALNVPLISIWGASPIEQWQPRGHRVQVIHRWPEWPGVDEIFSLVVTQLNSGGADA